VTGGSALLGLKLAIYFNDETGIEEKGELDYKYKTAHINNIYEWW
jgi:hypothetical protein